MGTGGWWDHLCLACAWKRPSIQAELGQEHRRVKRGHSNPARLRFCLLLIPEVMQPPASILYQLSPSSGGDPGARGHCPAARKCQSGLLPLPSQSPVFVLESDKLPSGGRAGWGVDQGLSFHGWPIITFFTVPSVGTTCRHFPGWWLQGPWAVSNDNSGKGHRQGVCLSSASPHLLHSPLSTLEPSPVLGASVKDTSASPTEISA